MMIDREAVLRLVRKRKQVEWLTKKTTMNTYIFHVGIVFGPTSMASSSSTSTDYNNICGTLQHIGQNTVPRIPHGEIEAAGTVKFFQISELVGILWIDKIRSMEKIELRSSVCKVRYLQLGSSGHHNVEPLMASACTYTYLQPLDCVRITARYREEDKGLQGTLRQKHTQVSPHRVVLKGILVTCMISITPRG
jgi:hypothetical protein